MADNDISKRYALNIEVNVDSSSLENLKNIQEKMYQEGRKDIEQLQDARTAYAGYFDNSTPQTPAKQQQEQHNTQEQSQQVHQQQDIQKIANEVNEIKLALQKRDNFPHSEHIENATNLANSDFARQVASFLNNALSSVLGTSKMSAGFIPENGVAPITTIDSSGVVKKIAATTGKKVSVGEKEMSDKEYGEYNHDEQKIFINKNKTEPVKKLSLNHESIHPVQEAKGYTGNTLLFHANANSGDLNRDAAKRVNEYLTNTAAIIRTALTDKLSFRGVDRKINDTPLRDVVKAYNDVISKTSGVVIKDIESFTNIIRKLSKINISPETFMSMLSSDLSSLGFGGVTRLSSAASLAGYHTKSDGTIRDSNGKIVSDSKLIGLLNEDGTRIKSSDISSHNMAHFVSGSAGTLIGVDTTFHGRGAFLRGASNEFSNLRDFGVQFRPEEDLARINDTRMHSGLSYIDIQRRLRENTAYTHREEPLYTEEEVIRPIIRDEKTGKVIRRGSSLQTRLKNPGNVRYFNSPVEKILFASGGGDASSEVNGMFNLSSLTKDEIYEIVKSYIFKGTGRNPLDFESETTTDIEGRHRISQLVTNYGALMSNIDSSIESYLGNGDAKNPATFIGTNKLNASLGDTVFLIRAAKRGLKSGYIPPDIQRVQTSAPEEYENSDGEKLNTLDNASVGHLMSEQLSQGEEIDLRNYERKRLAYERAKKAVASAREKFNALRLGDSSEAGLIGTDGSSQIMIGSRQVSSIEDIDRIEKGIESQFASYQRENPEIAKKEAKDNMLTALRGILGVLHGGEDIRKISTEQLEQESRAVIGELNAIPDFMINEAKKRNSTIKLAGVDVGVDGIIKTREAIKEYQKTMRNISSGGMFSTSKMAEEGWDPTKDLEYTKRQMRKRMIELAKDYRIPKEDINDSSIMAPILRQDPTYQDLRDQRKQLEDYIRQQERSHKERVDARKKAEEKHNADLQTPISYERTVNGKTVSRNVKFDKNEASVMGSIYENDYGAYNMAVGNLEALSTTTQAPLEMLKKIRKNRSYMNFVGDDGNIQDFASPLTSAMSPEATLRMRMLENPLKRILETSGSISGNAEKRVLAIKDILSSYLSRGIDGAEHQLSSFEDFINVVSSKFKEFNAKNQKIDMAKARELYDAIKYFNERTIGANSGLKDADASIPPRKYDNPKELAKNYPGVPSEDFMSSQKQSFEDVFKRTENRMMREGSTRNIYFRDFDIEGATNLLNRVIKKKLKPVSIDNEYERHQYKLISDESKRELDYATGSSVVDKKELNVAATALHRLGRTINPFSIDYKEGLTAAHYDLGDLSKYSRDEIGRMVKAAQNIGLQQTNADLIEVLYKKGKNGRRELTARSNDAISDAKELSIHESFSGDRGRFFVQHSNALIRGHLGEPALGNEPDVFTSLSANIKKFFNRFANGGASSSEIKKIAEDVSVIKDILSNGYKKDASTTEKASEISGRRKNSGSSVSGLGTSKMAAERADTDIRVKEEKNRRMNLAEDLSTNGSNNSEEKRFMTPKIEHAIFETRLAEATTRAEKLAIILERIGKVSAEQYPDDPKDKEKRELYLEGLRKRYNLVNNDTREVIDDKESYRNWLSNLKVQYENIRTIIKGLANPKDKIGVISSEVDRLSRVDTRGPRENDRKREIAMHMARLLQMRSVAELSQSRIDNRNVVSDLKESYRLNDAVFSSGYKKLGTHPEKIDALSKEILNVEESIKHLENLIKESRSANREELATSLNKVLVSRIAVRESLRGKYNREIVNNKNLVEREGEKGISQAQREAREAETINKRMVNRHNQIGAPSRSVFERTLAYGAMSTLIYGFITRYKSAIDTMTKFEKQMLEVTRVMDPLYQAQEHLSSSAKRLASEYGVSIIEAAQGMTVFAQQGKNATQIIQLTEASLLAANTTTMNAAQATEALTSAIRQFNLSDSDAKKVIDSWLEVESRTAIQAGTMADAIKISGTAARMAGLSFHEFNGILSAVGSATRETGSQLGTAFKFIISKMNTEDVINSLQKLGIATHNQDGSLRDMMLRLSDINSKWKDMTTQERASLAITIAGTRRYNTFMTLMDRWADALDAISMSEDSHGKAMRMNAMIMDTYEKRVQKAKASVESFYASMSKDATKGFLGNIQKSIEFLSKLGEKSNIASSLVQVGAVAGVFGLFTRLGGSMGIGTAIDDIGLRSRAEKNVEEYFLRKRASSFGADKNSWFARNFSVGDSAGRADYISKLNALAPEVRFNQETGRNENYNRLSNRTIDRLTIATFPHLKGKENTEAYAVAKDNIRIQFEKQLIRQTEYMNSLDSSSEMLGKFGRRIKAITEYLSKHAIALQGFGIALQSFSNAKIFENKNSITGKNFYGESLDLIGTAGSSASIGLVTYKMLEGVKGRGKISGILTLVMMLSKLFEIGESWIEKGLGSDRLAMQGLQKESDRIKTLNTSVSTYQRLRKRELNGEVLASDELNQKESAAEMIAMSSYGSVMAGHRGLGVGISEKEVDRLAGLRDELVSSRNKIDEELSFRAMFSGDASERMRKNLWYAQKRRDNASEKLKEFDEKHTGELSHTEMQKRADLSSEYTSANEEVQKYQQELTKAIEPYLLFLEKSGKRLSDRIRRGDSTVENVESSEMSKRMYSELLKSYNGDENVVRNVIAKRLISSNYQRGQVENSKSAISNYQNTGELHMLRKVGDKGDKSIIILRTYDKYGSGYNDEKFELPKARNATAYLEQISKLTGISKEALMYTGDLSDALFRYNLKEIEKFSEISRKIGEIISNSFKEQMDRVNSISRISTKYSFVGVEKQYKGFDKQLSDYRKASEEYAKGIGTFNEDIVSEIIKNINNQNPSEAISNAARISSRISGERNLLGIGYSAMNNLVISSQKSSMASQIMDAIINNKVKRGTDTDIDGIGHENSTRINEYLKESGLGFESVEALQSKLAGKSEEEIKKFLSERVLAAAEMYAKKDAESVSKALKSFEKSLDDASEKLKKMNRVLENVRQRDFAISISRNGNGGIINDSDIIESYSKMAGKEAPMDAVVKAQKQSLKVIESTFKVLSNTLKKAESDRDRIYKETEGKNDSNSVLRREMADKNVERASQRVSEVETQLSINTQKVKELERLLEEQKAMSTKSYGEFKVFMRNLESQSIKSLNFSNIKFGVGSEQFNKISLIDKQNSELNGKLSEFTSRLDVLNGKDKLTEEEKREQTELKIKIGEIEARLSENGKILQSSNESLLKIHAETIRRTRQLRVEHLANVLSRSKDTGRTQREIFNQDYKNTKDIFNNLVANYSSMSDSQKELLRSLGRKMEDLRDIGDLAGNPSFNKQYILASAQDRAIVDQIMQRRESGETMKQIFSDAGMKELGRSNPLVSQLMDNLMQKEQNERLLDTNNNMLEIQKKMLILLSEMAGKKNDSVLKTSSKLFRDRLNERTKSIPGFADGTTDFDSIPIFSSQNGGSAFDTGSGGKYESKGLAVVHGKEKLLVANSGFAASYPRTLKWLSRIVTLGNIGALPPDGVKGVHGMPVTSCYNGTRDYSGGLDGDDLDRMSFIRNRGNGISKTGHNGKKQVYINISDLDFVPIKGLDDISDTLVTNKRHSEHGNELLSFIRKNVIDYSLESWGKKPTSNDSGDVIFLDRMSGSIGHLLARKFQARSNKDPLWARKSFREAAKSIFYIVNGMKESAKGIKIGNNFIPNTNENTQKGRYVQVMNALSSSADRLHKRKLSGLTIPENILDVLYRGHFVNTKKGEIDYSPAELSELFTDDFSIPPEVKEASKFDKKLLMKEYERYVSMTRREDRTRKILSSVRDVVGGFFGDKDIKVKALKSRQNNNGFNNTAINDLLVRALSGNGSDRDISAMKVFGDDKVPFPEEYLRKSAMLRKRVLSGVESELAPILGIKDYHSTDKRNMLANEVRAFNHNGNVVDAEGTKNAIHELFHGGDSRRSYNFMDDSRRNLGSQESISEIARLIYSKDRRESSYTNNQDIDKIIKIVGNGSDYSRKMIRLLESISKSSKDFATIKKYFRDVSFRVGDKKSISKMDVVDALTEFAAVEMQRNLTIGRSGKAEKINNSVLKMQESILGKELAQKTFGRAGAEDYRRALDNSYAENPVYDNFVGNIKFNKFSGRVYRKEAVRLSGESFRKKYRSLREERGINTLDGKVYSIYNPIEAIRQGSVTDFFRAGGLNYIKAKAINFAYDKSSDIVGGTSSIIKNSRQKMSEIIESAKESVFGRVGHVREAIDEKREASRKNREKKELARDYRSIKELYNGARSGAGFKSWFIDNFTKLGLSKRKETLTERESQSNYLFQKASEKASGASKALDNYLTSTGNGYIADNSKLAHMISQESRWDARRDSASNKAMIDSANAKKYIPSIDARLAVINTAEKIFNPIGNASSKVFDGVKNVANSAWNKLPNNAIKVAAGISAFNSAKEMSENIKEGKNWKASESALKALSSSYYSGAFDAKVLDKIPGMNKIRKFASLGFYLSGGSKIFRGIKDKDAGDVISGTGEVATATLFSKPVQKKLSEVVAKTFGASAFTKFGKGMGLGTGADILGTVMEMAGDNYNIPWLKRTGQIVGGSGEAASDWFYMVSTAGANKAINGAVDAGRLLFDRKYRDGYGNRRVNVGGGFAALEKISDMVPMANGVFRVFGYDVHKSLNDINESITDVNSKRDEEEDNYRNRTKSLNKLLLNNGSKFRKNATRLDRKNNAFRAFDAINKASTKTVVRGPDAEQASFEAYFRNEDVPQMIKRYDVKGKIKESEIAQSEMKKIHNRLSEFDKEDVSFGKNWIRSVFGSRKERNIDREIAEIRLAQLEKAGSFSREKQYKNVKEAAQQYFNGLFGRDVNIFGKGGVIEDYRRGKRDKALSESESELKVMSHYLGKARERLFNKNELDYGYSSLSELEEKANNGDKEAQEQLKKFNESALNDKSIKRISNNISLKKKEIDELRNRKIDGDGPMTRDEFEYLTRFVETNDELKEKKKKEEKINKLKEQRDKVESAIKAMRDIGSSEDAIRLQQEKSREIENSINGLKNNKTEVKRDNISPKHSSVDIVSPSKKAKQASNLQEKIEVAKKALDNPDNALALASGKKIKVKIEGQDVEVDKETLQSWRDIKDKDVSVKSKAEQEASNDEDKVLHKDMSRDGSNETNNVNNRDKRKRSVYDKIRSLSRRGKIEKIEKIVKNLQGKNSLEITRLKIPGYVRGRIKSLQRKDKNGGLTDEQKQELSMLSDDSSRYKRIRELKNRNELLSKIVPSVKREHKKYLEKEAVEKGIMHPDDTEESRRKALEALGVRFIRRDMGKINGRRVTESAKEKWRRENASIPTVDQIIDSLTGERDKTSAEEFIEKNNKRVTEENVDDKKNPESDTESGKQHVEDMSKDTKSIDEKLEKILSILHDMLSAISRNNNNNNNNVQNKPLSEGDKISSTGD